MRNMRLTKTSGRVLMGIDLIGVTGSVLAVLKGVYPIVFFIMAIIFLSDMAFGVYLMTKTSAQDDDCDAGDDYDEDDYDEDDE